MIQLNLILRKIIFCLYILHWKNISPKNQHKSALNQWRNSTSDQQIINCQLVISKCCIIQKKRFSCKEPTMIINLNIDYMVNSRFYTCLSFCPQGGLLHSILGYTPPGPEARTPPPKANTQRPEAGTPPPPEQTPPWSDTPRSRPPGTRGRHPLPRRSTYWEILECNLV